MNELTKYYFSYTTAEEQSNYFTGEVKNLDSSEIYEDYALNPGEYRIIDGKMVKLRNDLSKDEIRIILKSRE